jgi:PST family polysaccharide transporter
VSAANDTTPNSTAANADVDLENAVRGGTRAVAACQLLSQLISFAVLAALYRLIDPDQFGLLGMVIPLLLLSRIFATLGLNVATVQRQHLTDGQLSSLFWFTQAISLAVAVATACGGLLLAWLYETPILRSLCAVLAGTLVVAALGTQHQAILERKLRMGRLAVARILAQAAGGAAAIGMALAGYGVWALVAQQYVEYVVLGMTAWAMEPWRPFRPGGGQPVGELLRFGGTYSLSSLVFYVAQNADKVLIAVCLGSTAAGRAALGMYSQAYNLMMKPVYVVSSPITGIMLPSLSRVAGQPERFSTLVAKFYRMVGIVLIPAGVGLFLVAVDLMLVMGGEPWRDAGRMLMAMAPTILVQGFLGIAGSVFASAGRAGHLLIGAIATMLALLLGYAIGYGLGDLWGTPPIAPTLGVAWSLSFVLVVVVSIPYLLFCFHTVQVSFLTVFRQLATPALASLLMACVVFAVQQLLQHYALSPAVRLSVAVACGVIIYVTLARHELRWFMSQLRDVK